jgi:hypothetical protein
MAPRLKTANATATATAMMDSVDNFTAVMCFAATLSGAILSTRPQN